jgi:hypothetical protein
MKAFVRITRQPRFASIAIGVLGAVWGAGFYRTTGVCASALEPHARSVPVLLYHGVMAGRAGGDSDEGDNISFERFHAHMLTLYRLGWQTVHMQDLYRFLKGEHQLPEKSFLQLPRDASIYGQAHSCTP